ncbi:hypothetical protein V8C40DRAFT_222 [Trichoderma camerunense]
MRAGWSWLLQLYYHWKPYKLSSSLLTSPGHSMWITGFYGTVASHDECEAIFQVSLNRRHLLTWLINSLGAGISFPFFLFSFFYLAADTNDTTCTYILPVYYIFIHSDCALASDLRA